MASSTEDLRSSLRGMVSDLSPFPSIMAPFIANPYPMYDALRPLSPFRWESLGMWAVTEYDQARAILRNPNFITFHPRDPRFDLLRHGLDKEAAEAIRAEYRRQIQFMPPERHKLARPLATRAFLRAPLEQYREMAREMALAVLDAAIPHGGFDVVRDFAGPVSSFVVARVLGAPQSDWPLFLEWTDPVSRWLEMFVAPEDVVDSAAAIGEVRAYFEKVLADRDAVPEAERPDDVITALLACREDGLAVEEAISLCVHSIGGSVNTGGQAANAVVALARHPEQWELVRGRPERVPEVIEETLRWDPTPHAVVRLATEPTMVGEAEIPEGDAVLVLLGAANRDPKQIPEAEIFNIARDRTRHITFGLGAHYCLGADAGRITAEGILEAFVMRVGQMELDADSVQWHETLAIRRMASAQITVQPL